MKKDVSVMIDNVKFNYRAGLMIEHNNKILVEVNPKIDFVTIPGGRVQTLEDSKEALKREIKEEMNYDLNTKDINLRAVLENFFGFDDKKYHELYFLYKINIEDDSILNNEEMINRDSENSYYKWVSKKDLKKVNLLPACLINIAKKDGFDHIIINDLKND